MRKLLLVALVGVVGVLTPACGGGGGSRSSSGSPPVSLSGQTNSHGTKTVKDGDSVEVEMDDFYFGPTFIKAPANGKVTVELKNEGKATHTFTADDLKIDEQLNAGESKTIT